jgi:hypothetical protein
MFIPRVTSPHRIKHAIAHALLAGVTLAVVPAFAQQEQIDSTKSVITIHVFKSGLFSSFAQDVRRRRKKITAVDSGIRAPNALCLLDYHCFSWS